VGAVDMTEHQSVGAPYGIKGFPTIKVFSSNKQKPLDYQGTSLIFHSLFCSHDNWAACGAGMGVMLNNAWY